MAGSRIACGDADGRRRKARVGCLDCAIEALERRAYLSGVSFSTSAATHIEFGTSLGFPPVVAADLNHDGKADLVMVNAMGDPLLTPVTSISVLLGNGDGTFQPAEILPDGGAGVPIAVTVADVNGDGAPDIITCNYNFKLGLSNEPASISVFLNNGNGTFAPAKYYAHVGGALTSVVVGDFDGHPDIVAGSVFGQIILMPGNGDGTFGAPRQIGDAGLGATTMAVSDLTGDGKQDLIVNNEVEGAVTVLLGEGNGSFQPPSVVADGNIAGRIVRVADLNDDGIPDIVVGGNTGLAVLLGVGNGTFEPAKIMPYSPGGSGLGVADFTGDGIPDLVIPYGSGLAILPGKGDGTFGSPIKLDAEESNFVVADVNGDGQPDLVTISPAPDSGSLVQTLINQTPISHVPLDSRVGPAPAVPATEPTPLSIVLQNHVLIVTGTSQADVADISASGGNLTVNLDSIEKTVPSDQVASVEFFMGAGDDSVSIGPGTPPALIEGGSGADTILANNAAADTLSGGAGGDSLLAGAGNDLLQGGAGNDTLIAGGGADTLLGNGGNDSLVGGLGHALMEGGAGADTLVGGAGSNSLLGGTGNDSLVGGGTNLIYGGGGSDTIAAGPNDSVISNSSDIVLTL